MRPEDAQIKITEKQQARCVFQANEHLYFLSGNPHTAKWLPSIILIRLGDLHFEIHYEGKRCERHVD